MKSVLDEIKSQVWRVAEVRKKLIDEEAKLDCLRLDQCVTAAQQSAPHQTPPPASGEPLLTVEELAAYLKTSSRNIRQKTEAGKIQAFAIGKTDSRSKDYRYRLVDVLRDFSSDPLQAPVIMQRKTKSKAVGK